MDLQIELSDMIFDYFWTQIVLTWLDSCFQHNFLCKMKRKYIHGNVLLLSIQYVMFVRI